MARRRNITDPHRHPVPAQIEHGADQDPGIKRHCLAGFKIDFGLSIVPHINQKLHQLVALIIGAGNVVPAAQVNPFEQAEIGLKVVERFIPGALQRLEVLLAQRVHMQAIDQLHMLLRQLIDRKAQP